MGHPLRGLLSSLSTIVFGGEEVGILGSWKGFPKGIDSSVGSFAASHHTGIFFNTRAVGVTIIVGLLSRGVMRVLKKIPM